MRDSITLRPIHTDDEDFLFVLFKNAHEQDLGSADLPAEQKNTLLRMQFTARQHQYRERFPRGNFDLILEAGKPVGIIYTQRGPEEFVLIDIALLPELRNEGIGKELVSALIREAQDQQKAVTAHVRKDNPAWRLWQRLGFEIVGDDGVYLEIRVPFDKT